MMIAPNRDNRGYTKQKLLSQLKKYKGILKNPIIDYLNSLIELEFSVIRNYIPDNDRKLLSELNIYRKIATYNIYNRALDIFNNQVSKSCILGNNEFWERLVAYIKLENTRIDLFDFEYNNFYSQQNNHNTTKIGTISLFQTLESNDLRNAKLEYVIGELEKLYDEKNPYHFEYQPGQKECPYFTWPVEHAKKIEEYEKKFAELDKKQGLTDKEKYEIEITKKYHDLLMEDYGLTTRDFGHIDSDSFEPESKRKINTGKTLVKKMPNLTITDNIKYI